MTMTEDGRNRLVVVTGASTGIGLAIAVSLARAGYTVLAGVRAPSAAKELRALDVPSLHPIELDVTDQDSIRRAFETIDERVSTGQSLYGVVNNAAISVSGPLEGISLAEFREQFEVNLFGAFAVTQAALPHLIAAKGRIINIGSNVSRLAIPFQGPYAATKAGLESLSDTWRRELKRFDVHVSLVVPGPVMTPVWDKIARSTKERMQRAAPAVKQRYQAAMDKFTEMNQGTAARSRTTPEDVGQVVVRCLGDRSPSSRYEIGPEARMATVLSRTVPTRWLDRVIHEVTRPRGADDSSTRPLSGLERMYYYFNHHSSNNVVAICELDGLISPDRIAAAIPSTIARHPYLQCRVEAAPDGTALRFVQRTDRHGLFAAEAAATIDVPALVTREMNARLDPHDAMIRVVYVRDSERSVLLVSLLHIVSDAKSAMLVLRDLLRDAASPEPADVTEDAASWRVPEPPEARLPTSLNGVTGIPRIANTQLSEAWQDWREKPARLPAEVTLPFESRRNGYLHRMIDDKTLDGLRRACREHDVTVHGILTAALAIALADEMGLRGHARSMINVGSPVNLREEFEPPLGDELGSYVCTLGLHLNVGQGETRWTIARQVNEDLKRRAARREGMAGLALVDHVSPKSISASGSAMRLIEQRGPGNVCISNLGVFDFPERVLEVPVRAAHWTAPLSVTGYILCAVCTTSRGLSLDFSYVEGVVSEGRAQRILTTMLEELTAATR